METWFIIVVSLCIATVIRSILLHHSNRNNLPPGPSLLHSSFLLLTNPPLIFESVLISLKATYGPLFTLSTGLGPSIFVCSHSLTHQLLIKKGALFSDRPKFFNNINISTASYGPTWRLLRRNIASEIMHPNRVKSYSEARKWALHILISGLLEQQLLCQQETSGSLGVQVGDHFRHAIFRLTVLMCFGEKFDDHRVDEIAKVQRDMLLMRGSRGFMILAMFPRVGKILFPKLSKQFEKLSENKEKVLVPIIEDRIKSRSEPGIVSYVDSLANLELPEKGRKITQKEMVEMCSEFLNGGTDTTTTALQWIMANLVKHPHIQSKLYNEIVAVVGRKGVEVDVVIYEEDLQKMPYVKAVVLEGLRRHPPAHLLLPHRVMKEVEVEGYTIPQGSTINFMVGEMGLDPGVWDEPMEFKPERFLTNDDGNNVFDITGSKGIKMMPFGVGRRIRPGSDLALLHLEYFVANLIWYFDWIVPDGYHVDLSEKTEFTIVMKNPLIAQVSSRAEEHTT